jgi:hypothetical protein
MNLPAYCSYRFLEEVISQNPVEFINPDKLLQGRNHFELLDLLMNGLSIETDCSKEKLENTTNPIIKFLKKNNRIFSSEKSFTLMRENFPLFIKENGKPYCIYLLTNIHNDLLNEYSLKTGNYFVSPQSQLDKLFADYIQFQEFSEIIDHPFGLEFFDVHNSVVLTDPYLFATDSRLNIERLLEHILPKKIQMKYSVTLVGCDKNKPKALSLPSQTEIAEWIQRIDRRLNRTHECCIDYHIYNGADFHDRIIITNNSFIYSGIGLNFLRGNQSVKDSSWVCYRLSKNVAENDKKRTFVYQLMLKKLAVIKKWISKSNNPNTDNPLFKPIK